MNTLHSKKRLETPDTPLLLFECQFMNGERRYWSTHRIRFEGEDYSPAVVRHDLFELQASGDDGIDGATRLSLTLANVDSQISQIDRLIGFKGAALTVRFAFFDLASGEITTDSQVVFKGLGNPAEEVRESTVRLSFVNRLNLQRSWFPKLRIQRTCPWRFPTTLEERTEAADGGRLGRYSTFYPCGYSVGCAEGRGNVSANGEPYEHCSFTRNDCEERGMFDVDDQGRVTRRFGGIEYVPASIMVRTHGDRGFHGSPVLANEAKYNDFVPLIYGTAWYQPPIVFARNDGNLTYLEALLGAGEITDVLKVTVAGVEIPKAEQGKDMSGTGWFSVVSTGAREGSFNPVFRNSGGEPAGDPYGSMSVLSIVVPNSVATGEALPKVQVLVSGIKLPTCDSVGVALPSVFTNNPAWVLLDLLRRSGWDDREIDAGSFHRAAEHCSELVPTVDLNGNARQVPRYQCNLVIRSRLSAAELIRGVRRGAGLLLRYGLSGLLELTVESSVAMQQPLKSECTNSVEPLNGGWPTYEFGDGSLGFGDIVRRDNGEPAIRFWSRSVADTPNRYSVEFQDEFNQFQQDGLCLVDFRDVALGGQEVSSNMGALGIANFNQAGRLMRGLLDRSIRGNRYVEFETGVRGIGVRPGDIITLTYLKDGYVRQAFRVLRVAPRLNYSRSVVTAQIHDDSWYSDASASGGASGRAAQLNGGMPRPLCGAGLDEFGDPAYGVTEKSELNADGSSYVRLSVAFAEPTVPQTGSPAAPAVSLATDITLGTGEVPPGRTYYYGVTAVDPIGNEGRLSFVVRAEVPSSYGGATVTLKDLVFERGADKMCIYRGPSPQELLKIANMLPLSDCFEDDGTNDVVLEGPPDGNFDHANFYWRWELVPEVPVHEASASAVGNLSLALTPNEYRDRLLRITRGRGKGQERRVVANSATSVAVNPPWTTVPDETSRFTISEAGWQFGALSAASPIEFAVPSREGATVQICGRAANARDLEASYDLSLVGRWTVGGMANGGDIDVPGRPVFGLTTTGRGTLELSTVAFEDTANTQSVAAGTLTVHFEDEIDWDHIVQLLAPTGTDDAILDLQEPVAEGAILRFGREVIRVLDRAGEPGRYIVERAAFGSLASLHPAAATGVVLKPKTVIVPFVRGLFGSSAAGAYHFSIPLPNVRIAAAEMFATNSRGNGQTQTVSFTHLPGSGIRTLSGGQYCLQVSGPLAVQSGAIPPLRVEAAHAIRSVRALLGQSAEGGAVVVLVRRNGAPYCELSVPSSATESETAEELPSLRDGDELTLDIVSVAQGAGTRPGRDLTVTVQL